ncbi:hypothetical protein Calkr_0034 [Caldicellulosiruptor acetigenus I77R1B]|uniref:Uncharacterized protein n=1 Tax=Caldicellulosiruptor acetigenus (strain ATCC 700853 / DSM 12137 / I77R1B) TaxID=632335 RepID=E4S5F8_CALA7|nr:hypothetical protein Calkr_0034 [Caldicellulosiruptor acetigenus I77R1B]
MACKISDMIKGSIKVMMGIYISLLSLLNKYFCHKSMYKVSKIDSIHKQE